MTAMDTTTRGAIIIGTSIILAALVFKAADVKNLFGKSERSGLVREATTYTIDSDTIYENSSSGGKWEIYKSDYNISDCPVLSPDGEFLAFAEGGASYGRFPKVLRLNGGLKGTVILDGSEPTFNLLERLMDSGQIAGKEIVHVFVQFWGWTPDRRLIVRIVGDYSLSSYEVGAIMTVGGDFTDVSVSEIANPYGSNAKKKSISDTPASHQAKPVGPRFDFAEFAVTSLPSVVIFSGIVLGFIGRKRRDAARIASGMPPLVYAHQVGFLAMTLYVVGICGMLFFHNLGGGSLFVSIGALLHFLRIGSLRKQAEKEVTST